MIRLTSKITIADTYVFNGVVSVAVESSWMTLTDTCTVEFPKRIKWNNKNIATGNDPLIKKGDSIKIECGYDDNNDLIFDGFITAITAHVPVKLECQDHAWTLKKGTITRSYKDIDLPTLLSDILVAPERLIPFEAPTVRLGPFRISKATPAKVLDFIKTRYLQKFWFRNGTLYAGLAYQPSLQAQHEIYFNRHVVEHDLVYLNKDDVQIKLKVINISPDNKKKEYEFGDPEGEQRTLHYYDKNESEINTIGEAEIDRLRYDGYRGSITIFGQPFVQHGDVVKLIDALEPERSGRYLVKSVSRSFGSGGYRQTLELDQKWVEN